MSRTANYGGGGFTRVMNMNSQSHTLPKVKNPANQEMCERLKEKLDSSNNDNLVRTLSKAIQAVASEKEPITSYEQAIKIKNVGPFCARIMCPAKEGGRAAPLPKPAGRAKKKTKTASKSSQDDDDDDGDDEDGGGEPTQAPPAKATKKRSATATTNDSSEPSAKEKNYQSAKQEAIAKWSHPISVSRQSSGHGLAWKVLLLVDGREPESQHILSKCSMSGIPAEERHLPIGDMTWVAQGLRKVRTADGATTTTVVEVELMLGTIIERKTTKDLISSLFGTRYDEQRLRLKHSGQPQVLFLIEGDIQKDEHEARIQMALMETRIDMGFQIINSKHMDDTVVTLKRFHRRILQRTFPQAFGMDDDALPIFGSPEGHHAYGGDSTTTATTSHRRRKRRPASLVEMVMDTPPVPAFGEPRFMTYIELKCKIVRDREAGTRTVGAIYGAMLRQLCGEKQTNAIRQSYPTPSSLLQAYEDLAHDTKKQETMVANCIDEKTDGTVRKVGPKTSKELYIAYCTTSSSSSHSNSSCTGSTSSGTAEKRSAPDRELVITSTKRPSTDRASARTSAKCPSPDRQSANTSAKLPSPDQPSTKSVLSAEQLRAKRLKALDSAKTNNLYLSGSNSLASSNAKANASSKARKHLDSLCVELLSSDEDGNNYSAPSNHDKENNNAKPAPSGNQNRIKQQPAAEYAVDSKSKTKNDNLVELLEDSSDEDEGDQDPYPPKAIAKAKSCEERRGFSDGLLSSQDDDSSEDDDEGEDKENELSFESGATVLDAIEID